MCYLCSDAIEAETSAKADDYDEAKEYLSWCIANNEEPYMGRLAAIFGLSYEEKN